ncbi:MAG: anti-sigma factor [Cyanobacteria bacterium P01_A01_bin.105]
MAADQNLNDPTLDNQTLGSSPPADPALAAQRLAERAADYVAGNLSTPEAEAFVQLMTKQPELKTTVRQLEKTVGLMLDELTLLEPPPQLADRILAAAAAPAAPTQISPASPPRRVAGALSWALGAIAIGATLAALALGGSNRQLRLANQQLHQDLLTANQSLLAANQDLQAAAIAQEAQLILHQRSARFYDFEGTAAAEAAYGNMVVDTTGLRAALAFQNLAPLPPTQTYALWVVKDGSYIFCGAFEPDTSGEVFVTLPMPEVYQAKPWVKDVMVTIEPQPTANHPPANPTGPVVAQTL